MCRPGPDDPHPGGERPLSVPEQQAFDRLYAEFGSSRLGWRHEYVTVQLPKLRTALVMLALVVGVSILLGAAAAWWAVAGLVTALVLLPWALLYATERGNLP
jgi:hypothetical protein